MTDNKRWWAIQESIETAEKMLRGPDEPEIADVCELIEQMVEHLKAIDPPRHITDQVGH